MSLKGIPLSKKDFDESGWNEIIKNSDKKECLGYSSLLLGKARKAEKAGEEKKAEVLYLLGGIASLILNPDNQSEPFGPLAVFPTSRSAIIDDFTDEHLTILNEILPNIDDPELKSRIADVLWIVKRDHEAAEIAINAYLESADVLEDPEKWTHSAKRIERSLRLAAQLGKNAGHVDTVILHIESVLDKYDGEDPLYFSHRLMDFLIEFQRGDNKKYASLSEKIAIKSESDGNWSRVRAYWETKAKWHALESKPDAERAAKIRAAETYVKEAGVAIKREKPSFMLASAHLQFAIEAYRRIGEEKEKIKEIHKLLLEHQEKSVKELKEVSTEINLEDTAKAAVERVKGKSLFDALFALATLVSSPKVTLLQDDVENLAKDYPVRHLFPTSIVNDSGRITGKMPNMLSNDPKEAEKAKRAQMFEQARFHHELNTQGIIEPARRQINLDHNIRTRDFFRIVTNNPFVPPGRELIFAKGLQAGMEGDFIVAAHLLIPQLENSVRYVLSQHGVITSGVDSDGIQDERSLNTTLYHLKAQDIFGEDVLFDLQGLLVERFGYNLRNLLAHGLLAQNSFYILQIRYLWWLTLHLCCLPIVQSLALNELQQKEVGPEEE
ncbi:hypothetical protein BMS3Bbin16_00284 [archaeon BMS3Bbin16]|nr:hypothetical protein BMS3Bbin16_00284 [archaeon BMS3Bbin16]